MSTRLFGLVLASVWYAIVPDTSQAWNSTGHRTIASIIFRRLTSERRQELAELLRHHPRYQEDFVRAMPLHIQGADSEVRAEWLLQQASYWPDIVREGPPERKAYDRPFWHYLPRAFYLDPIPPDDFRQGVERLFNSLLGPSGGTANTELNGPQALKANLLVLNDRSSAKSDRAVALCWVLHVGQDLHQPCHTVSLCSPVKFPEGDQGANLIKTEPLRNLHAVWDSPLGPDDRYETCRDLAVIMLGNTQAELNAHPIENIDALVASCLAEGMTLAETAVYVGEVRAAVMGPETETVRLSPEYFRQVRSISNGRMVLAGMRLSTILAQLNNPSH